MKRVKAKIENHRKSERLEGKIAELFVLAYSFFKNDLLKKVFALCSSCLPVNFLFMQFVNFILCQSVNAVLIGRYGQDSLVLRLIDPG